jgi:hypothetical protein
MGQQEVLDAIMKSGADVIEIVCSRGYGKTLFAVCSLAVPPTVKNEYFQLCWIAPNYKIARAPIDDVLFGINEETGERFIPDTCPETGFKFFEYKKGDNEVHWWNNAKWFLRSADAPDSIVSKGYNMIVIDEAALILQEVWQKQILPIARKKNCKIILISTPRGKNWFYQLFLDGLDAAKKRYFSIQQPWWKRPDYPQLLIDLMKDLPKHIREQEFEAKFLDAGGGIFGNFKKIFYGKEIQFNSDQQEWYHKDWRKYIDKECVMSVDFAKSVDYTVIAISDINKTLLYYCRLNKTDYKTVLSKIDMLAKKFNYCDLIYDATGVGNGLGDFLGANINAYPFVFTNESKNDIIHRMAVAFEYAQWKIPNIVTVRNEFELLEMRVTKTGKISYSAPDGKHDDVVMSMSMLNWYIENNVGKSEVGEIDDILKTYKEAQEEIDEDDDDY